MQRVGDPKPTPKNASPIASPKDKSVVGLGDGAGEKKRLKTPVSPL